MWWVYYVCYHCGIHMTDIGETLTHIKCHFSSSNDINIDEEPLDAVDVKYEVEEIFIDCNNKSMLFKEDECLNDKFNDSIQSVQQTSDVARENYSNLDGIFE